MTTMIRHQLFDFFCDEGLCEREGLSLIHPKTRDRENVQVYQCGKSNVIFLSSDDHVAKDHYDKKAPTHKFGTDNRAIVSTNDDALRRKARFANQIRGKIWLDVGAGSGAVLDALSPVARKADGVEPQANASQTLSDLGYQCFNDIAETDTDYYDVVSFFHVLEHIPDTVGILKESFRCLKPGGQLIVEVPHARDFLIHFLKWPSFKDFTFWSEHLTLHTRQSLELLLNSSGFSNIVIEGVQRYPVANHLQWLANNKPGGHIALDFLRSDGLDREYEAILQKMDMTDTIIATARKPLKD